MGELVDRDQEHLRLLKYGYYVLAGISGFATLFSLTFLAFGTLFAMLPIPDASKADARVMGPVFLIMGVLGLIFGGAFTYAAWLAARGLEERRRRTLCYVMAVFASLSVPWGTCLGIATFIVLNRPAVRAMFERPA